MYYLIINIKLMLMSHPYSKYINSMRHSFTYFCHISEDLISVRGFYLKLPKNELFEIEIVMSTNLLK